jgi:glycosyltransferase involved in cell wall biosynthesis
MNSKLGFPPPPEGKTGWPWTIATDPKVYQGIKKIPKISIITPSYNQGQFIEETIRSVLLQNYPNLEYIIIDGGSTDNTIEVIKKYQNWITYWVSEKDNGQSHAINKGFSLVKQGFVTWLNSDDIFLKNSLAEVAHKATITKKRWIAGNLLWINPEGLIVRCGKGENWNKLLVDNGVLNLYGPSSFIDKSIIDEFGGLDESFHYLMDIELWWRIARQNISFARTDKYIWAYRLHAESKMSGHHFENSAFTNTNHPSWLRRQEEESLIIKNYDIYPTVFTKLMLNANRLLSFNYCKSYYDRILYKGKPVASFPTI